MDLFGVVGLGALALIAVLVAAFFLRRRLLRTSVAERRNKPAFAGQPRLEVLESTDVDDERRLVLVRCDGVEHLIMTGGPADVVVENDVRKLRGAPAAGARSTSEPDRSFAALTAAPASPPRARPAETAAPSPRAATNGAGAARPAATVPPASRAVPQQELQPGRREPQPQWRNPQQPVGARAVAPAPVPPSVAMERQGPPAAPRPAESLPSATTPWPPHDSIEDEIVEALRFERNERPQPAPATGAPAPAIPAPVQAAPHREPPSRERRDTAATTLGDLAERLEEALAREVQSSSHYREPANDFEPIEPQERGESAEPRRRLETKPRPETRERSETARPAPEPETRREAVPDRREEAPVISLNSRRRETVDPLEDEMARLLGELTGDTKGR